MSNIKKFTCPNCNAGCGLLIEVENNEVLSVKPDKDHPLSRGYCCPKGLAWGHITNDKDRLQRPLKRVGAQFQQISWKQALHEIADQLHEIREKYTPNAIAYYMGTNSLQHYAHSLFVSGFMSALKSSMMYNAGSVDNNNNFVAQYLLYGSSIVNPIPDLVNTDLFIIVGSNPLVTNLSLAICTNIRGVLKNILKRGGEIYVIDPRRNETAKALANDAEHYIPIVPDTDIYLLLAMMHIILMENLMDNEFIQENCTNSESLKALVNEFTPEVAEKVCQIPSQKIYDLTRKFVKTKKAVLYGRIGTALSTFSTLDAWAIEVINILAGKLDRPGGKIFGKNLVNIAQLGGLLGLGPFDTQRSRIGNYPDVMGAFPLATLAREITMPKNPIRALIISGGNPVLSSPNSNEFKTALKKLDLCVMLDYYINETASLAANYILPVKTPLENANYPLFSLNYQLFPHIEYVAPVRIPDEQGPKAEWEILLSLIHLLKLTAFGNVIFDIIPKFYQFMHKKFDPEKLLKILFFLGQVLNKKFPYLSSGALTLAQLKKRGTILLGRNEYNVLKRYLRTKNKKIPLVDPQIMEQVELCRKSLTERLAQDLKFNLQDDEFLLIGQRNLKTSNSWLHNIEFLWRNKDEPRLLINPSDANRLNLQQDEMVILRNEIGSVELPIEITEDIIPKVLCYPHGWGHKNTYLSFANQHPGENINQLTDSYKLDKLSGMPLMNGYKVQLIKK